MKRLLALCAVLVIALAGCSDKKDSGGGDGQSGDDAVAMLTAAKKSIDDAASVHIVLTGRDLPDNAQTLASGDGVATHAPAFKGKLTVRSNGAPIDAQVVVGRQQGLREAVVHPELHRAPAVAVGRSRRARPSGPAGPGEGLVVAADGREGPEGEG